MGSGPTTHNKARQLFCSSCTSVRRHTGKPRVSSGPLWHSLCDELLLRPALKHRGWCTTCGTAPGPWCGSWRRWHLSELASPREVEQKLRPEELLGLCGGVKNLVPHDCQMLPHS
eukprot:4933157-Amphidinium_carterae.1